jgi:hypothetical protein
MNIVYHSVVPQNEAASYTENDQIDFLLDFQGRKLLPGSVRLEAVLNVTKSAGVANDLTFLKLDEVTGAHALIESLTTETAQQGNIEVISSDYSRYVKMKRQATMGPNDFLAASKLVELCSPDNRTSSSHLRLKVNVNDTTPLNIPNDFSLKLENCINNINGPLSYNKSGYVKLSAVLAQSVKAFYGGSNALTTVSYNLEKVRIKFQSVPEDNNNAQLTMRTAYLVKQTLTSASANVSSKVPSVCSGFVGSFLKTDNDLDRIENSKKLELPPAMQEVRVLFNDNSNNLLTYNLRNVNDQILKGAAAFGNNGDLPNMLSNNYIASDCGGYILGANFDSLVNLTNQKINVQVASGISNVTPHNIYLYFLGVVSM